MKFQDLIEIGNLLEEPQNTTEKLFKQFLLLMEQDIVNKLHQNSYPLPCTDLEVDGLEVVDSDVIMMDKRNSDRKTKSAKSDISPLAQEVFKIASDSNFSLDDTEFNLAVKELANYLNQRANEINLEYNDEFQSTFKKITKRETTAQGKISRLFTFSFQTASLVKLVGKMCVQQLFKQTNEFIEENLAHFLTGDGGWGSVMHETSDHEYLTL